MGGELTKEKKAEIREAFLKRLQDDPDVPYSQACWSNTLIPQLVFHLPVRLAKWAKWRVSHHDEIKEENDRLAEEERREEEERRRQDEEDEQAAEEKEKLKVEKAKRLAERKREEEEKKRRWAEEAAREAEEAE